MSIDVNDELMSYIWDDVSYVRSCTLSIARLCLTEIL